jgi:5-hydroxyisourate hydrolase
MGRLTTHVLDTASGKPAAGMWIELHQGDTEIKKVLTNDDGRVDSSLLEGDAMIKGEFTLRFHVGDYYASKKMIDAKKFLDVVPVVFFIDDPKAHYHVPLLVSPWAYSTYRGS